MKKIMRQLLALILVFILSLGLLPTTFAMYEDDFSIMNASSENITESFTDQNFLAAVRDVVGKPHPEPILKSDVEGILELIVQGLNIANLSGIQFFTSLETLNCLENQLTTLDVSQNTALKILHCGSNPLTDLDVSNNIELTVLDIINCNIESIDVSKNTKLVQLDAMSNRLTSIDVNNNEELGYLSLNNNNLTHIDVSANPELITFTCSYNKLTSLDVSANPELKFLHFERNNLTGIDISANIDLLSLTCSQNRLTGLDLSNNPNIEVLWVDRNRIASEADIIGLDNLAKLDRFDSYSYRFHDQFIFIGEDGPINIPDPNFFAAVREIIGKPSGNILKSDVFDIEELDVSGRNIMNLIGIEHFSYLKVLAAWNNQLSSLDVSSNRLLISLDVTWNQLTSLDVSANPALRSVMVGDNRLTTLDLSSNTDLTALTAWGNRLETLDVSNNTALTWLSVGDNQLTILDISKNTSLETLYASNNELSSLILSIAAPYEYIDVSHNRLAESGSVVPGNLIQWDDVNYVFTPQLSGDGNEDITESFTDRSFLAAVREIVGKPHPELILKRDVDWITNLWLWGQDITNLAGIEHFTMLQSLSVDYNHLTTLDVSANSALTILNARWNELESVKLSSTAPYYLINISRNNLPSVSYVTGRNIDWNGENFIFAPQRHDPGSDNYSFGARFEDWDGTVLLDSSVVYGSSIIPPTTPARAGFNFIGWQVDRGYGSIEIFDTAELAVLTDFWNLVAMYTPVNDFMLDLPDEFKKYLRYNYMTNDWDNWVYWDEWDDWAINEPIYLSDVVNMTRLYINGSSISDITGIEHFTSLRRLTIRDTNVRGLDLSTSPALRSLDCSLNNLRSLNISNNTKLQDLDCSHNRLESLNVRNNPELQYIISNNNRLTSIDVGNNENLWTLYIHGNHMVSESSIIGLDYTDVDKSNEYSYRFNPQNIFTGPDPIVTIPDVIFEAVVRSITGKPTGEIRRSDVFDISNLNLSDKNIASLAGIEHFIGLEWLNVRSNNLTSVNLSTNTELLHLDIGGNQLTALDLRTNTDLIFLDAVHNQLTTLNTRANTKLQSLYISNNQLTTLDTSGNPALETLYVGSNRLTALDVRTNLMLYHIAAWDNRLTTIDVSANTALSSLYLGNNNLTTLNVGANAALVNLHVDENNISTLDVRNNALLESLGIWNNPLFTTLDVSRNLALRSLHVGENNLSTLDVSRNIELEYLHIGENNLITLDISKNTSLQSLSVWNNRLTAIDISANPELQALSIGGNLFTSLDVSGYTGLRELHVGESNIPTLDVRNLTLLSDLSVSNTRLTALDVKSNTALRYLNIRENPLITTLDVRYNTSLLELYISENSLTELDVSSNRELRSLVIEETGLTTIDVRNNTLLRHLHILGTQLNTIDLSANRFLKGLSVTSNQLSSLSLTDITGLVWLDASDNQLAGSLNLSTHNKLEWLEVKNNNLTEIILSSTAEIYYIDVSMNYLANTSAVTGRGINWDGEDFIFHPQKSLIADPLTGTATITCGDDVRIGDTITGSLIGSNNTGILSFTWKSGGEIAGTGTSYIVRTGDVGRVITLEITSNVETGTLVSTATPTVLKRLAPPPPEAPTMANRADTTVTLNEIPGVEYRRSDRPDVWQDSTTFTGLSPNTSYVFIARIKETDTTYASAESLVSNPITTLKSEQTVQPPTLASRAATSITLNTIAGAEYGMNDINTPPGVWQDSPVFSGLSPNTTYFFFSRMKETGTHNASPPSTALSATTERAALSGTVIIIGIAKFGQQLTADTTGLATDPAGAAFGALTYQWRRNGTTTIGTNSPVYTLVQADISATISVVVTAANCNGSVTSAPTPTVTKADGPAAPAAPTMASRTATSITLGTIAGAQYAINTVNAVPGTWQSTAVFGGLSANTPYYFFARIGETATHFASPESLSREIFTDWAVATTPNASINFLTGQLTGLTPGDYRFTAGTSTPITESITGTTYTIPPNWMGTTVSVVRLGNELNTRESLPQNRAIPARPASVSVTAVHPTIAGGTGGLGGTTTYMEYRNVTTSGSWIQCAQISTAGLQPGTYQVRIRATQTAFAGVSTTVRIIAPSSPAVIAEINELINDTNMSEPASVNAAVEALRNISTNELANEKSKPGTRAFIKNLEDAHIDNKNINVEKVLDPSLSGLGFDSSQIEVIGAGLNATGGLVTLSLSAPQNGTTVSPRYGSNAIRLSMTLEGTGITQSNLAVPVTITIPIPAGFNAANFRILHYYEGGGTYDYTIITPTINGDNTATFVLTRFSEFALVEVLSSITTPSVPQNFRATPGNGQVALTWAAPVSNGGSAVTSYQVTRDNWATSVTVSGNNHTFTGLANGTTYTFRVRAVNIAGDGSAATATAMPVAPIITPPAKQWQPPLSNNRFIDVPNNNWQNAAVSWADSNRITTGSPAGSSTFKPNDTITRAEFVTFFHRIYGSPSAPSATFSDMPVNSAFQNAISWASAEGITTGSPAGSSTFMPNANITREQIAAMLYRYIGGGTPVPENKLGGHTDQHMISTWAGARDAVNWAVHNGIMGVGTTILNPRGNATRAEAVTMLYRVVEIFDIPAP